MNDLEITNLLTKRRIWNYERIGVGSRDIEFLPHGEIGLGKERYEYRWEAKCGRLFVYGDSGRATMVLVPKETSFSGRWAIYGEEAVIMTPVDRFGMTQRYYRNDDRDFYQPHHLRDCAYSIHYLRKLARLYPQAHFRFFANSVYHREIKRHIDTPQIELMDSHKADDKAINCWMENWRFREFHKRRNDIMQVYVDFFKALSKEIGLECPIRTKEDMLFDHPRIKANNPLSGRIDYLFINSEGKSGQFENVQEAIDGKAKALADAGKKVLTTRRVDGIPCTLDYDLGLLDVGNLSTTAKVIVGINTAPLVACFNVWNRLRSKWIVLDQRDEITFNKRIRMVTTARDLRDLTLLV